MLFDVPLLSKKEKKGIIKTVRFSEEEWLAPTVIDRRTPPPGWVSNEDGPNFLL